MMAMDSVLRDRITLVAALGAGVVVGVSGIYMYYKMNRTVARELSHLAGTIDVLKREIEDLKTVGGSTVAPAVRLTPRRKTPESQPAAALPAQSSGSDEQEEEYYDFTDTEDTLESWATINGPLNSAPAATAAPVETSVFDKIDATLDDASSDKEALYQSLKSQKEFDQNAEYLWRLSKATHLYGIVAQKRKEMEKRRELAFEAHSYAKKALEIDKTNPEVHKWCAITLGSIGTYVSVQEKIQNGYTFKNHAEIAVRLKPKDPTLHHMLGRWSHEVAGLSWLERKMASTLFSEPPTSTHTEARTHLLQADELKPEWIENMLFIAKTYIAEGDYTSAISWLDKAADIPVEGEDDELAHVETQALQHKYKGYRQ